MKGNIHVVSVHASIDYLWIVWNGKRAYFCGNDIKLADGLNKDNIKLREQMKSCNEENKRLQRYIETQKRQMGRLKEMLDNCEKTHIQLKGDAKYMKGQNPIPDMTKKSFWDKLRFWRK